MPVEVPYGLDAAVKEETFALIPSSVVRLAFPSESALLSSPSSHSLLPFLGLSSAPSCAQSCLTLCNTVNCSLPGSSLHGTLQARTLGWVATSSSRGSSRPGIKLGPLRSPAFTGRFFTTGTPWEALGTLCYGLKLIFSVPFVGRLEALLCVFVILGP